MYKVPGGNYICAVKCVVRVCLLLPAEMLRSQGGLHVGALRTSLLLPRLCWEVRYLSRVLQICPRQN